MKLGCCVNMTSASASGIGDENINVFKALGYDYIELPLAQVMALSDEEFSRLHASVREIGLPVEACNNFFPASVRLTGEDADLEKALGYVRRAVGRAAGMGVKIIVMGSSGAKNIPEGFPYPRAKEQLVTLLKKIQDIVAPFDITVAIEPLNSKESNFILTVAEGFALMNEVDLPNIRLLADYYHMRMEDEGYDIVARAGKDLRHVHIAAKEGRLFPRLNDGEDYAAFFDALRAAGYDARVSVESFTKDVRADAEEAARVLRPLMGR